MNKIKTKLNGQAFEIEIEDGMEVTFAEGKITVRSRPVVPTYYHNPFWVQPWVVPTIPYTPPYEPYRITCGTGTTSGGIDGITVNS
jgi:hypothetical protein